MAGDPFIQKLEHAGPLTEAERTALQALPVNRRLVPARQDIVASPGVERVYLVLSGIAGRYKTLLEGSRRIVSFVLPGDLCWVHAAAASGTRDLRVGALTPCSVADFPRSQMTDLIGTYPGIGRAMWWVTLTELSRSREWLVNDSRPAEKRLAHHFCELLVCLRAVGFASENSFELKLTQIDLADALGISHVHINRILQGLRSKDLIVLSNQRLTIPDVPRLAAFAEFDPGYLCLSGLDF
ncbi:Crp/Fnr family transcriptional regulator [Methylobacterium nigriterrae]|uniref:Crp/Fnr family transcriptional regulator n=1 Tax=Methylobacterium nigriterrae TaxID=3127512 RepID=UPI00301390D8